MCIFEPTFQHTHSDTHARRLGSDQHAVCHLGKLYFCHSRAARRRLMARPARYLALPPALPPHFHVALVASAPLSSSSSSMGGSRVDVAAVATALAAKYACFLFFACSLCVS
jgi:hypothetical protein